jgi:hypothetical protein
VTRAPIFGMFKDGPLTIVDEIFGSLITWTNVLLWLEIMCSCFLLRLNYVLSVTCFVKCAIWLSCVLGEG